MTNGFALNHDKSLQMYVFYVKRQAKNDFLKEVESTVGWMANLFCFSPRLEFVVTSDDI